MNEGHEGHEVNFLQTKYGNKKEWHCLAITCFVSQEEEEDSRLVSLKYIRLQKKTMVIGQLERQK